MQRRGLHKVLNTTRFEYARSARDLDRSDFACQHGVCMHVVGMCGFFDHEGRLHGEARDNPYRNWKIPVLVGVEHESAGLADGFPKRRSSP